MTRWQVLLNVVGALGFVLALIAYLADWRHLPLIGAMVGVVCTLTATLLGPKT